MERSPAYYWIYSAYYYDVSFFSIFCDSSFRHGTSEMSGGGIFLTLLRATEPGSELHSFTSIWIAIVQVCIHPLPKSLLHRNEPKSESLIFYISWLAMHLVSLWEGCTDLFLVLFRVQDVSIFLSMYGSLRQALLFVKASERVRAAISPNYHISWRPFNPGVSYEQILFSDLFRLNLDSTFFQTWTAHANSLILLPHCLSIIRHWYYSIH